MVILLRLESGSTSGSTSSCWVKREERAEPKIEAVKFDFGSSQTRTESGAWWHRWVFLSICLSKKDVLGLIQLPKARGWSEQGNARARRAFIYGWRARVTPIIDPWGRPNISVPSNKANNFYMTLAKIHEVSKMMLVK